MSQQFTGIPLGKHKVLFIDVMLILALAFFLIFLINPGLIIIGVIMLGLIMINPVRMSAMMPIPPIIIIDTEDDTNGTKQ